MLRVCAAMCLPDDFVQSRFVRAASVSVASHSICELGEVIGVCCVKSDSELANCENVNFFDGRSVAQLQVEASSDGLAAVASYLIVADTCWCCFN